MCYLVAKKRNNRGSFALSISSNNRLIELDEFLSEKTINNHIQIIPVGDIKAYGEYAPYKIFDDEDDFVKEVLAMA